MENISTSVQIAWIAILFGILSLFSALLVILTYAFSKSMKNNFAFKIIVYLQISDFLLSISIIMIGIQNFSPNYYPIFCKIQAFLLNFGVLATSIWTFLITLVMFQSLKIPLQSLQRYDKYYVIFGYSIPLILTFLYLGFDVLKPAGYWCWVDIEKNPFYVFLTYAVIVFVIVFNALGVFSIFRYMKKLENMQVFKKISFLMKLRFYPLVLSVLWFFPLFNRFAPYLFHYHPKSEWTAFAHIFCESLLGFANMVLLALNPKTRMILKKFIFEKKNSDAMSNSSVNESEFYDSSMKETPRTEGLQGEVDIWANK